MGFGTAWEPTVPNFVTIARVLALLPLAYCWLAGDQMAALVVFALAALSDMVDGWLSRLLGQESAWGKRMDPVADKIFVYGTALLLLPQLWLYAFMMVFVVVVRDVNVERLRINNPRRACRVPTLLSAKAKTWFFMVGLGCVMAEGSLLDQLPVSAMGLAYGCFSVALICALYSWAHYDRRLRTRAGSVS